MALSDADKERARYHLGYMEVTVASTAHFGVPQATETQYMFESAIQRVMAIAEPRVRDLLNKLDEIEKTLFCASKDLFAKRAGDVETNLDQPEDVENEYVRWACRLADMLGIFPYPYSSRFAKLSGRGGRAGNIRVRR